MENNDFASLVLHRRYRRRLPSILCNHWRCLHRFQRRFVAITDKNNQKQMQIHINSYRNLPKLQHNKKRLTPLENPANSTFP